MMESLSKNVYNLSWRTSQDSCFQDRKHSTNHSGRVIVKTTKSWFFWGELRVEALTTGNITVFASWIRGYFMIFNGYFYDMSWYFLIFQGLQYMTSKPVFRASRTSSGSSKWLPMVNADSPSSWFNQNRVTMMTALFFSMQEMHTRPPKMTTMWFQFYHVSWRNCSDVWYFTVCPCWWYFVPFGGSEIISFLDACFCLFAREAAVPSFDKKLNPWPESAESIWKQSIPFHSIPSFA